MRPLRRAPILAPAAASHPYRVAGAASLRSPSGAHDGRGNGAYCIAKVARGWMLQLLLGCRRGPLSYIQRIGIGYVLQ
jgi:hypothetical protein